MLCDVQIPGVGGLFYDLVEVIDQVQGSGLGKASGFCSAEERTVSRLFR
jgi:hypothetical protein